MKPGYHAVRVLAVLFLLAVPTLLVGDVAHDWRPVKGTAPSPAASELGAGGCSFGTPGLLGLTSSRSVPFEMAVEFTRGDSFFFDDPCDCQVAYDFQSLITTIEVEAACDVTAVAKIRGSRFLTIDEYESCFDSPAAVVCDGDVVTFKLKEGLNEIELPLKCPCADKNFVYFTSIEFLDTDCPDGRISIISTPGAEGPECVSFTGSGDTFFDEAEGGIPGVLVLWGRARCCNQPVTVDEQNWGALKDLFRP